MKKFMKILAGVWISGAVMGGGCFCGAVAAGALMPKRGPSDDYALVQAQIAEMQATLESFTVYDEIAMRPIDEFAGMEGGGL